MGTTSVSAAWQHWGPHRSVYWIRTLFAPPITVLAEPTLHTPDLGGKARTEQLGKAVADAVQAPR